MRFWEPHGRNHRCEHRASFNTFEHLPLTLSLHSLLSLCSLKDPSFVVRSPCTRCSPCAASPHWSLHALPSLHSLLSLRSLSWRCENYLPRSATLQFQKAYRLASNHIPPLPLPQQ